MAIYYIDPLRLVGGKVIDPVTCTTCGEGTAPVGTAIYSIIAKEAEAQIVLENNTYESDENYLTKGVFNYELQ